MTPVAAVPHEFQVMRDQMSGLHDSTGLNMLLYWPHGFGDFVFLGHVLPLLNPKNRYFICRIGDDNSSVFEGSAHMTPLYAGCNSVHGLPETQFEPAHLGLRHVAADGKRTLYLPVALAAECQKHGIQHLLDPHFPEIHGREGFPFHTKARHLLRSLLPDHQGQAARLSWPLENAIHFDVPESVTRWVEARLHSYAGWHGRQMCIIGRNGYTCVGKNWGHRWREDLPPGQKVEGQECRDFMRLMLARDPNWLFLTCEDRLASGHNSIRDPQMNCVSYAELFGSRDQAALPYGWVMRTLMNLAELVVGVPSGPYHLAMVKKHLPVVGIWIEHFPSWYDEPKAESIHLISRNLADSGAYSKPGTFSEAGELTFHTKRLETRIIPGQEVFEASASLLGFRS
jgi:hypothetical protein